MAYLGLDNLDGAAYYGQFLRMFDPGSSSSYLKSEYFRASDGKYYTVEVSADGRTFYVYRANIVVTATSICSGVCASAAGYGCNKRAAVWGDYVFIPTWVAGSGSTHTLNLKRYNVTDGSFSIPFTKTV